jgi:hypothetical protein
MKPGPIPLDIILGAIILAVGLGMYFGGLALICLGTFILILGLFG